MRFFGFGKKRAAAGPAPQATTSSPAESSPTTATGPEIVVYGTADGARCRQLRALLDKRGIVYRDVRVDEDLSTRSWLQRTTGDDALPKAFIGTTCYGGFEDLQVLAFDGTLERILRGEETEARQDDELAALKKDLSVPAILRLLRQGEILTIKEGEMEMEAWAEPLANPPQIYYEGLPHAIEDMEGIVEQIVARLKAGEIQVAWKED
jgi:glutaredoxin 3